MYVFSPPFRKSFGVLGNHKEFIQGDYFRPHDIALVGVKEALSRFFWEHVFGFYNMSGPMFLYGIRGKIFLRWFYRAVKSRPQSFFFKLTPIDEVKMPFVVHINHERSSEWA